MIVLNSLKWGWRFLSIFWEELNEQSKAGA